MKCVELASALKTTFVANHPGIVIQLRGPTLVVQYRQCRPVDRPAIDNVVKMIQSFGLCARLSNLCIEAIPPMSLNRYEYIGVF